MAKGVCSYDALMSPNSWMQEEDLDFCAEILNLMRLRDIDGLPDD